MSFKPALLSIHSPNLKVDCLPEEPTHVVVGIQFWVEDEVGHSEMCALVIVATDKLSDFKQSQPN